MAVSLADILSDMEAALNADLGDNDFSGTGKVARGRFSFPPAGFDFIAIASPTISSVQGPPVQQYTRTATIEIHAWAASATPDDSQVRAREAETLLDEIMVALENARIDVTNADGLYGARTFVVSGVAIPGDFHPVPVGAIMAVVQVQVSWIRVSGA